MARVTQMGSRLGKIPIEARVLAVADVYDSLAHDRPYRKALPQAEVIAILREEAGHHLDPLVVEACIQICLSHPKADPPQGEA